MKARKQILLVLVAIALVYWSLAYFRYSWVNDCLTKMQMLKNIGNILTWDGEKKCK
jgi:hypothetical protein